MLKKWHWAGPWNINGILPWEGIEEGGIFQATCARRRCIFLKTISRVIHAFKMYLLSTYYVADTRVGTYGTSINKADKDRCPCRTYVLWVYQGYCPGFRKEIKQPQPHVRSGRLGWPSHPRQLSLTCLYFTRFPKEEKGQLYLSCCYLQRKRKKTRKTLS